MPRLLVHIVGGGHGRRLRSLGQAGGEEGCRGQRCSRRWSWSVRQGRLYNTVGAHVAGGAASVTDEREDADTSGGANSAQLVLRLIRRFAGFCDDGGSGCVQLRRSVGVRAADK